MMTTTLDRPKSDAIYASSCAVIPGGVNSPVRSFPGLKMTPIIAQKGLGDQICDADGSSYVDFCGSWGALILGHAPPSVVEAVIEQVRRGSSFGMATEVECRIAEKIISILPSIEKIRLVSSGTEAVMSAVRLARGFTGKSLVVKFDGNYHGHADGFLIRAGSGVAHLADSSSKGIPSEHVRHTASLPYNDLPVCRAFLRSRDDIAAVVLEPVAGNMGVVPPDPAFLQMLREETANKGIVLIFDEVITGFRVGLTGAQGYYGIAPDMTCLGKVIGGGYPAAAFGGKKEIMEFLAPLGPVYQAGTLSGNPVAMAAGLKTLEEISQPGFYEELERKTRMLVEPIQEYISERGLNACLQRAGSMFTLFFGVKEMKRMVQLDEDLYRSFFVQMFERGIYFPPSAYEASFVCSAHTDDHLEYARDSVLEFLREI